MKHIHTTTLEVAYVDGECGVAGTCEGYGHDQPEHEGTCRIDPYMIDVENEIVYRILCDQCASEIADDI